MTDKLIAGNGKVEFGSFVLEELFTASKGDTDLQKRDINGKGQFVVTSGETNQGIEGRTDRPAKIFPSNTITIDFLGNVYYREYEYKMVTHNRVCSLSGNVIRNDKVGIYLVGVLSKLRTLFSYNHAATWDRLKVLTIELPVTSTNDIDYEYMEERIAELEQERIAELDAYLAASGLDDYELTDEDKEILSLSPESASDEAGASEADHGNRQVRFKKFALGALFTSSTGDVDLQQKDINGKGEFLINSGAENRGIKGRTDRFAKIFPANTITIDFWGNAYYRDFEYKMATHNHVFSLAGDVIRNRLVGMYIVGMLSKLPKLFSYNNMATWNKLKNIEISLPVTSDGDIDFDYMERYIRAIEKLAIADVAKYKDKIIDTTKQLVTE